MATRLLNLLFFSILVLLLCSCLGDSNTPKPPATPSPTQPKPLCYSDAQRETVRVVRSVATALQAYATDEKGKYPNVSSIHQIAGLLEPDYIKSCPRSDAWGHQLIYVVSADRDHFRVASAGADGIFEEGSKVIGKAGKVISCQDYNADIIFEDYEWIQWPEPDVKK